MKKQKTFKLTKYLKKYWVLSTIGPILKILEAFGDVITPYLVSLIIDVGIPNNDKNYIYTMIGIIFLINVIGFFLTVACHKCSTKVSTGVSSDIRRDMFRNINSWSHAELDDFSTGSLTNRLLNDIGQVNNAIGITLRMVTRLPILLIGSIIMAMIVDLELSIIFVIVAPIISIIVVYIMLKSIPLFDKGRKQLDIITNTTRENLSGVRVVRAFNKQREEERNFEEKNKAYTHTNIAVGNLTALMQPLLFMVINFAIIAIIWFGGIEVHQGPVSTGKIIAFINYFSQISMVLVALARIIIIYTRTGSSIKRIDEILAKKNTVIDKEDCIHLEIKDIKGKIEYRNVSFGYSNTKDVVKNLSITINPMETIGFIGGTGSGKSSAVGLIPRFYDVTEGEILIDEKNVKDYSIKDLRKIVGIVPQNPILFEGTLRENLRWRKEDATEEEIIKALKIAQAYDFVKELPDFLEHHVERGGVNFSGGQRQRLTIARALVGAPRIIILDDSASALDFATDSRLRKAIKDNLSYATVIIVSQRTNSIKDADNIVVMDHGNIVDIGSHGELLARCELYREIYYSQNKKEEA